MSNGSNAKASTASCPAGPIVCSPKRSWAAIGAVRQTTVTHAPSSLATLGDDPDRSGESIVTEKEFDVNRSRGVRVDDRNAQRGQHRARKPDAHQVDDIVAAHDAEISVRPNSRAVLSNRSLCTRRSVRPV